MNVPELRRWFDGTLAVRDDVRLMNNSLNAVRDDVQRILAMGHPNSNEMMKLVLGKRGATDDLSSGNTKRVNTGLGSSDIVFGKLEVKSTLDPLLCAHKFVSAVGLHPKDVASALFVHQRDGFISIRFKNHAKANLFIQGVRSSDDDVINKMSAEWASAPSSAVDMGLAAMRDNGNDNEDVSLASMLAGRSNYGGW